MNEEKITIFVNGVRTIAQKGWLLSEISNIDHPCGGHGKCGKCKVIVKGGVSEITDTERAFLSDDEIDSGIRLACLTHITGNCYISYVNSNDRVDILTNGMLTDFDIEPLFKQFGAVIDVGTTTLAARLYDKNGKVLSSASRLNSQRKWGSDVISRVEAALSADSEQLVFAIRRDIDAIISELIEKANSSCEKIDYVVITGNTVMLSLLVGEDVEPFSHAPFAAKRLFGETVKSESLGLKSLSKEACIYFPPCVSAFVGADLICAVLATELYKQPMAMLVDIGTNGEMALMNNGILTVCSTAAGPAFEAVEISCGMRSESGAIDRVIVTDGNIFAHVIGDIEAAGICGSGLVDAIACILDMGLLDENGYMETPELQISGSVYLSRKDVRMLQLAKSAICAGLMTLVNSTESQIDKIPVLYVSGGFGSYINKESAAKIGLIPKSLSDVTVSVGNAALDGGAMLLLNSKLSSIAENLAQNAKALDLSKSQLFVNSYIDGMLFKQM